MQPSLCCICSKRGLLFLNFARDPQDWRWYEQAPNRGSGGRPLHRARFCWTHFRQAWPLRAYPLRQALQIMRGEEQTEPRARRAGTYSVMILDMFHISQDEGSSYAVDGFPTLELAKEFARRWVRDSLEEMRSPTLTRAALREQWFAFGEDAVVLGGNYSGCSELDFFIDHPAAPEERDWQAIKKEAGIA
jgi:hypothetical protein